jgi:hypothetical protein
VSTFESPIEEKMAGILEELGVTYACQVEVGGRHFPARCKSARGCRWQGDEEQAEYAEGIESLPTCECDDFAELEDHTCRWLVPAATHLRYRLDFALEVYGQKVDVECDGAGFHRSEEQVAHDLERDRWLKDQGWLVRRFTGGQIISQRAMVKRELRNVIADLANIHKAANQSTLL